MRPVPITISKRRGLPRENEDEYIAKRNDALPDREAGERRRRIEELQMQRQEREVVRDVWE